MQSCNQHVPFFYSLVCGVLITWLVTLNIDFFDPVWTSLPMTIIPSGLFFLVLRGLIHVIFFLLFGAFSGRGGFNHLEYLIRHDGRKNVWNSWNSWNIVPVGFFRLQSGFGPNQINLVLIRFSADILPQDPGDCQSPAFLISTFQISALQMPQGNPHRVAAPM